ncbi:MAG: hypothetical protein A3K10_15245 [Bacteroidetes bacterium RIFCSPLOWO2_12_FULL_31_6]|nr:MAG: hypothetical protein A3K10_15245 [Bacteroidetes bacterium RIFCSPLOWO2_12_FULL_31_6]
MKYYTIAILIIFTFCNSKQETEKQFDKLKSATHKHHNSSISKNSKTDSIYTYTSEIFIDSLNIGEKGNCKIEILKNEVNNDFNEIVVIFYVKNKKNNTKKNTWLVKNKYSYETLSLMGLQPNISDFNNDKFNDINFISATAARGSNEVRRLFIYEPKKQELIAIINSQDYPNMQYNKELNCIDAFLVHGTSTTVFAKISGDSLITFANVQNSLDFHTVNLIDKNQNIKELYKVKSKGEYIRFKNFKPLIINTEEE